ncbi:MAG: class F sortase [Marmoricola sp.]
MPSLVVAALALPWVVAALGAGLGTSAPGPTRTDHSAALAAMLLGPSAPVHVAGAAGGVSRAVARSNPGGTSGGASTATGVPVRIVVPVLDVDAPVRPISGQSGTLVPPGDATSIGWWQEGRRPGAAHGAAVLTGHTVHTGGGAFDHLGRLRPGDTVLVRTTRGWVHYEVDHTVAYRKGRLAHRAAAIFSARGRARLVLVTCTRFDGRRYLANTVVSAVPVPAQPSAAVSG